MPYKRWRVFRENDQYALPYRHHTAGNNADAERRFRYLSHEEHCYDAFIPEDVK